MRYHARINLRLLALAVVVALAMAGLGARLWKVQIVDGAEYTARLASRSELKVRIPPVRGEIRDRNGIPLAQNRGTYEVDFYLPEMVRAYRDLSPDHMPKLTYRTRVRGMLKDKEEADIVRIVDASVLPRLEKLGIAEDYDPNQLMRHYRNDTEVPFTYCDNLDFQTIAKLSEHDLGLPGVGISMKPVRYYPYGALAAHLLGYVGAPNEISELADVRDYDFYDPNVTGKSNVELHLDKYLQGTPGIRWMQRNVKGVIDQELRVDPPKPGANVYLTIDARIQSIAECALRVVGRGAAVVVDPNTGDVLAMASVPSYDPNIFIPRISAGDWQRLNDDPAHPLVNRAINAFPPGSTFKIITALAGLKQGLAERRFTCSGGVSYGDHYFKCWISGVSGKGSHGTLKVSDAIKVSCNAFFYQYGNAAGIDAIDAVGNLLGLGQPSKLPLTGEQDGILPGPEWMRVNYPRERWSAAYTANVSIGQGYDLVSPLQLVMAYSTIANGGTCYQPRLIKQVLDDNRRPVLDENSKPVWPDEPQVRGRLTDLGVSQADIALLRHAFWRVVNEDGGTARRARLPDIAVAGKTGTAQNKRDGKDDTIAWFVCFAPADKPQYAVCAMVQGGAHGGSVAAPIAARILQETLAMNEGTYHPQLQPLPPARMQNPFQMLQAVNFDSPSPSVASAGNAGSAAADGSRAARSVRRSQPAQRQQAYRGRDVRRAEAVHEEERRQNLFQRFFSRLRR